MNLRRMGLGRRTRSGKELGTDIAADSAQNCFFSSNWWDDQSNWKFSAAMVDEEREMGPENKTNKKFAKKTNGIFAAGRNENVRMDGWTEAGTEGNRNQTKIAIRIF